MSSEEIKTSAIILNWNGKHFLKECFDSLRPELKPCREIILVDNGSKDGSIEFVEQNYPFVKIIRNSYNMGFSKAVNIGIHESKGKYIALLNNDILVLKDWFEELENTLDQQPDIGFCASKMILYDHQNTLDAAGNGFHNFLTYSIGHIQPDSPNHNLSRRVFGSCAGAAMYRKSLFDEVGYFDEDFFINAEDNDLSFRANLLAFKCKYVSSARVLHHHSGTIGAVKNITIYYFMKNSLHLIVKNIPLRFLIRFYFKLFSMLFSLCLTYVIAGQSRYFIKAVFGFVFESPKIILKRIMIQKNIRISMNEIRNIILDRYK